MSDPRDALFNTPAMADQFSAESHVAHMLQFEAALARAEARAGVIPAEAVPASVAACQVQRFRCGRAGPRGRQRRDRGDPPGARAGRAGRLGGAIRPLRTGNGWTYPLAGSEAARTSYR